MTVSKKETSTNKRKSMSTKIRFEVFKRDSFTCQYCGKKAPEVLIHVDHVQPVSKGGTNDMMNLVTSCFDCNLGKSDRELSDTSVLEKQRKQVEAVQERREQIELMFKWKKSLSKLDDETVTMIKDYIDFRIKPLSINEAGERTIRDYLKKYGIEEVLNAVDISGDTYLKYSKDGDALEESAQNFFEKLGGILYNRRLTPIEQQVNRIKKRASDNFGYYDPRKASILLREYVDGLRHKLNYSEQQVLEDLEGELGPRLRDSRNWSEWRNLLDGWIESINREN